MEKVKKFRKTTDLFFSGEKFRMTRTNHLFEARAKDKQRDQYINEDRYKKIITLALQNGLKSFRAKGGVVVVIANSNKRITLAHQFWYVLILITIYSLLLQFNAMEQENGIEDL